MRYIKSINEFFDSDEIKSQVEIPFLKGEISFSDMIKDDNLLPNGDKLPHNLLINCPFVGFLNYEKTNNNLTNFGFQENLDNTMIYFLIEIMSHSDKYICNVYAKCFVDGRSVYDKKINKNIMDYEHLVKFLNGEALNLLIDFTKFTDESFNFKKFPYKDRNYMSNLNVGRN